MNRIVISAKDGFFLIACPIWANDVLEDIPAKRWSKAKGHWRVPILKQNVAAIERLAKVAGVEVNELAMAELKKFAKTTKRSGRTFPTWYKFKTKPRNHQARVYDKAYGTHAFGLWWSMQTGKTKAVIDLCVAHHIEGRINGVIVFVKRTLRRNWIKQLEQHCPIPFMTHMPRTENKTGFQRFIDDPHKFKVLIVGWESLSAGGLADMCDKFVAVFKCAAVGDETTYIMNMKAERTKRAVACAHACQFRYAMNGTPGIPMDLYAQYEFLDPNIIGIGDFLAFRNRYAIMGGYYREIRPGMKVPTEIIGYKNMEELTRLVAPFSDVINKEDEYDLPPKRYEVRTVELTKEQRTVYDTIKREGVLAVKGKPELLIENILGVALRLHQVAGGFAVSAREEQRVRKDGTPWLKKIYDPVRLVAAKDNPKLIELASIVQECKGRQGLIWAAYAPEIDDIVKLMKDFGLRIGELHGRVDDRLRQPMVNKFEAGELDWIVGNVSTGGMGFTMMAAEVNIFYNNTEKWRDRVQGEDRSWGDGQTKSGVWIDIMAEKTVDVSIKAAIDQNLDLADYIKGHIGEIAKLLDGELT